MMDDDDLYFHFTANAVPHSSLTSNGDVDEDKFRQFTTEELANLNLEGVAINIEHNLDDNLEPMAEDTTVGYIAKTMQSDRHSMLVIGEIPPVPAEVRATPEGSRLNAKRKAAIKSVMDGELKEVSVAHANQFTLVGAPAFARIPNIPVSDDLKFMVEKQVTEVSLTKEGGRAGSRICESSRSATSLLPNKLAGYATPVCKSYAVIPGGDINSVPQYVRANLKNFNFSVDKENNTSGDASLATVTDNKQNMATPAVAAPAAPTPTPAPVAVPTQPPAPTQAAVVPPTQNIQPGSDEATAYMKALREQSTEIALLKQQLEESKKSEKLLNTYQERDAKEIRDKMTTNLKRFNDDTISMLENDEDIKKDPVQQEYVKKLKLDAAEAEQIYAEKMLVKADEATGKPGMVQMDPQDLIKYLSANQQVVHAFNTVIQKHSKLIINKRQNDDIATAKAQGAQAAAAAPAPPTSSVAAPAEKVNTIRPIMDRATLLSRMRLSVEPPPIGQNAAK